MILNYEPPLDVEMIILFGSYARDDWVEDVYKENDIVYEYKSDFDVLVVTEKKKQQTTMVYGVGWIKKTALAICAWTLTLSAKKELEYLSNRVRKLHTLTRKVCKAKIEGFAEEA